MKILILEYKGKTKKYKVCENDFKRITNFQNNIGYQKNRKEIKEFIRKYITEKKKGNYNFSLKYPIDYRYLSFNHITTLKLIWKINKTLKIGKIQNALNDFKINLHIANIKFIDFCECSELKRQNEKRLSLAWE